MESKSAIDCEQLDLCQLRAKILLNEWDFTATKANGLDSMEQRHQMVKNCAKHGPLILGVITKEHVDIIGDEEGADEAKKVTRSIVKMPELYDVFSFMLNKQAHSTEIHWKNLIFSGNGIRGMSGRPG